MNGMGGAPEGTGERESQSGEAATKGGSGHDCRCREEETRGFGHETHEKVIQWQVLGKAIKSLSRVKPR